MLNKAFFSEAAISSFSPRPVMYSTMHQGEVADLQDYCPLRLGM